MNFRKKKTQWTNPYADRIAKREGNAGSTSTSMPAIPAWGSRSSTPARSSFGSTPSKPSVDLKDKRYLGLSLNFIIFSLVALAASFILILERIAIYQNPLHTSSCDISSVLNCGTVMRSEKYAELFGFPNPLIGLIGFALSLMVGAALFFTNSEKTFRNKPLFMSLAWLGLFLAFAFISFLWFNTTFVINALCIYCMIVWVCTTVMFSKITAYNFNLPRFSSFIMSTLILLLFFGVIAVRFSGQLFGL